MELVIYGISISGARIAQLVHSLDLQSIDHKFAPHYHRDVFLAWAFRKPSLQIVSTGSDQHGKRMKVTTSG